MSNFVHSHAICESTNIGNGTRIWAFAHVLPGAVIGADTNICDGVFVENDVIVGDRVTVKCGVQLWDGITLESGVFIGPNATFTNDIFPRSKVYPEQFGRTIVREGASVGANATILPGLTIGRGAMIGAGAVITRDVPDHAIVVGNPGRITGYANTTSPRRPAGAHDADPATASSVRGVALTQLTRAVDLRGSLVAAEIARDIPFTPERFFIVYDVPSAETRGAHAHRQCQQFLIAVKGSVTAIVDDGSNREEYVLDSPETGLYMPPMTWGTQYRYTPDAVLLVLASHSYDNADYIRDYSEFLDAARDAGA